MKPIEYQGQRVLTTSKLAESYETDVQIITNNFNRNKDRYVEGKHFIALRGDEKQQFLCENQIDFSNKDHSTFYIWTEKGAWLHAKSLNTDKAWGAYEMLVDEYYRIKDAVSVDAPQPQTEIPENIIQVEKLLTILRENRTVIGSPLSDAFQSYIAEVLTGRPLQSASPVSYYQPPHAKVPLAIQPQDFVSQQASIYEKWYLTRDIADEAGVSTQLVAVVAKQNGLKSEQYTRVARSDPKKTSGLVQIFYNEEARSRLLSLLAGRKSRSKKRVSRK